MRQHPFLAAAVAIFAVFELFGLVGLIAFTFGADGWYDEAPEYESLAGEEAYGQSAESAGGPDAERKFREALAAGMQHDPEYWRRAYLSAQAQDVQRNPLGRWFEDNPVAGPSLAERVGAFFGW